MTEPARKTEQALAFDWSRGEIVSLLKPRKKISQHILTDPLTLIRIAESGDPRPGLGVIEIGPGTGNLTDYLTQAYAFTLGVEIDERLFKTLDRRFGENPKCQMIQGDILKTDLNAAVEREAPAGLEWCVISNLPYHITAPAVFKLLESPLPLVSIHLLVQEEVAHRIAAPPGRKDFSTLSIACQIRARCRVEFSVPPDAFKPAPKVKSALVSLVPYETSPYQIERPALFSRVVAAGFHLKRKTFVNNMKHSWEDIFRALIAEAGDGEPAPAKGYDQKALDFGDILESMGLKRNARAEEIGIEQFMEFSNRLYEAFFQKQS